MIEIKIPFIIGFLVGLLYSPIIEFVGCFIRGMKNRIENEKIVKLYKEDFEAYIKQEHLTDKEQQND